MKDLYGGATKVTPKKKAKSGEKEVKTDHKDGKEIKSGRSYRILIRPVVTEKASNLGSENKYVFVVEIGANKIEISKAINDVYGIKPKAVNIMKVKGKKVISGRISGRRKNWKKAIVTLPAGKTINIYEGV